MGSLLKTLNQHEVIFYAKTGDCWRSYDYTDYTQYTDYTHYTINLGETTYNRILAFLIQRIYKRPRPMLQAQSCNPAEYGGKGRHRAGICIKKGEPVKSDKLACCT